MKKINIILNGVADSGGGMVIRRYVKELINRGFDVKIYFSYISYSYKKGIEGDIRKILSSIKKFYKYKIKNGLSEVKEYNYEVVPKINDRFIRDADVVIATAWPTAFDVEKLSETKGKKFYFVQDYEIWDNEELGKKTYELPLKKIVISSWIKKQIESQGINDDMPLLFNGMDVEMFENKNKSFNNKKTINCLMLYHSLHKKGVDIGIKAFVTANKTNKNIKLTLFGLNTPKDVLPPNVDFVQAPSKERLVELYSNSDIFIFPPRTEGWGLTVIEAMASKCAVVGTNTGCLIDIGKDENNSLISETEDYESMAINILKLSNDVEYRKKISLNGYNTVKNMSWDKQTERLIEILTN